MCAYVSARMCQSYFFQEDIHMCKGTKLISNIEMPLRANKLQSIASIMQIMEQITHNIDLTVYGNDPMYLLCVF